MEEREFAWERKHFKRELSIKNNVILPNFRDNRFVFVGALLVLFIQSSALRKLERFANKTFLQLSFLTRKLTLFMIVYSVIDLSRRLQTNICRL